MNARPRASSARFLGFLFSAIVASWVLPSAVQAARIGLFLGTFDPPHAGIVRMVEEARTRLGLETVYVLPAPEPVERATVAPLSHRLAMLRIIGRDVPGFATLSEADLVAISSRQPDNLFTALREDIGRRRPGDEIFQIVGEDALQKLVSRRQLPAPDERRTLVVLPRHGVPAVKHPSLSNLERRGQLVRLTVEIPDVSGRDLRRLLGEGGSEPAPDQLPASVLRYIRREGLYGAGPDELTREEIGRFEPSGYMAKPVLLHGPTTETSFVSAHTESLLGDGEATGRANEPHATSDVPAALDDLLERHRLQMYVFQSPTTDALDWLETQGWRTLHGFVPPGTEDIPMLFLGRRERDWHLFVTGIYSQERFTRLVGDLLDRCSRFAIPTDRLTVLVPACQGD